MRFSIALTLAAAGMATAQVTCAAQNVLDLCVSQTQNQVNSCVGNDWQCLCYAYQALQTCYNNCPADPKAPSVNQQVTQFCQAASQYGTTTTSGVAAASSGSSPASAAAATTTASSSAAAASGSAFGGSSSSSKGAAPAMATPAAGALAMVLGAVALL